MYDNLSRVIEVDIDEILPNRFQPRIQFDEEEILELSDSIKEHGVIQPLVVRSIGDKYEIIAGERRYKASVLAGKETVPVIVKNLNDKDSAEIALIENIQRKNLTPIEEALSYKKILDMGYITQENLASKLGKSQSTVANKIRLLNLSDEVQEALLENQISERHARSLLKLSTKKEQNEMLDRIINERLTVRRADEEIEKIKNKSMNIIDEEEKEIKEEGEIDMNNNMLGIPNVSENSQPVPTFDIFMGSAPVTEPVQSAPVAAVPEIPTIQPVVAPVPEVQAAPAVPAIGGIQFDANGNVIAAPETPSIPSAPVMPEIPVVQPAVAPVPSVQTIPESIVPITAPIVESPVQPQPAENLFGVGTTSVTPVQETTPVVPEIPVIPEVKLPEPIIVTDYSKQYDPVMPEIPSMVEPTVDFKEVINAIRECSNKIEQYGFKIDVEEFDLSSIYQVIFKIEK